MGKALTLAVALSMAATPIFLMLLTRMEKTEKGKRARRMKSTKSNRGLLWPGLDDLVR